MTHGDMTESDRLRTHRATMKGFRADEVPMGSIATLYGAAGPQQMVIVDRRTRGEFVLLRYVDGTELPYFPDYRVTVFPPLEPGEQPDYVPRSVGLTGAEVAAALELGLVQAFAEEPSGAQVRYARSAIDGMPHEWWLAVVEFVVRGLAKAGYKIVKDES